ncbi:NACHT domain-containing protein [Pseudomonas violetae]|uniref:NACHT domain-containing protein n=1 Tax=Pseudomonas violetae TaxID=2915813 RepID=A0ABT0EYE9_9PSED|nr:NACHT domain-containing protein [Pseudomonas violetae]MCK1790761.1 NACHT domain-containing protein [Pseudomonas violetae]
MDKTRASRDGHEFHEAWAARKALQLVMPSDGLVGIAVEGLSPVDQTKASAKTVEIADLVLYYGKRPTFDEAESVVIVQLKYSKGSEQVPFRASDAKKTIEKFAEAFENFLEKYGASDVEGKLAFELVTNRPIYNEFDEAIEGIASGARLTGEAKKQASQFIAACGLLNTKLAQFAKKVRIIGAAGSLRRNKQYLSQMITDWSAAPDAMARARLGNLRQLLRDKAGLVCEGKNVISRTDVLDALELQSPDDLFPCPTSFPEVGSVVSREQLSEVVCLIPNLDKPLVIHADGGMGKTVFLQSLAKALSETHETVLFDCFGGGAYRAPEDARHLPKRGLIHITNNLACDGLCDPLLPINENIEELIRAFRARLSQAIATLRRVSPSKQLLLFIDAIDNAAEHAKDKGELSFPTLLLESFHHGGPVDGVQIIVSCRTYRRNISRKDVSCEEVELKPFSLAETEKYLRDRIPTTTDTQIKVAFSRSQGTPRILEHLALSDRGLLEPSEVNKIIRLDDLLRSRIQTALGEALRRGNSEREINAFLAGLAVLPPPVPLDEYADAHGIDLSAVKSFAADLSPLLEQTRHGLMFRDEPTETFVRESYAVKTDILHVLAENLFKKQGVSVYAASALPGLLQKLDDGKLLFDLAFDERFPSVITSAVGKQNIRYSRLKAAVLHAARKQDFDHLVHFLVELSTLAAITQRGADYILDNPDLVIASHDVDATRRLFETRTLWPGTRHARLIIASVLSGDLNNASRHAVTAGEWLGHFYQQDDEYRRDRGGPESLDIASIPLCLIAKNRVRDAAKFMKGWQEWYAYEVAEHLFYLLSQAQSMGVIPVVNVFRFLTAAKSQPGVLAAALSFMEFESEIQRKLVGALARACQNNFVEEGKDFHRGNDYLVKDGLLKAASVATSLGMRAEAATIVRAIQCESPSLWSYMDRFSNKGVFPFVVCTALNAAGVQQKITELMLLPKELTDIGARISNVSDGKEFRKALHNELRDTLNSKEQSLDGRETMSAETKRDAGSFIDDQLEPLLEMTNVFTAMLSSEKGKGDNIFLELVSVWARLRNKRERYSGRQEVNTFFDMLGQQLLSFSLWSRSDLKLSSVKVFVLEMCGANVAQTSALINMVEILSRRIELQELAGKTAIVVKALIEFEDEVDYRASLFAKLARAIMSASFEEAASYFRAGIEQMDAIGSNDYQFTNELLIFASELKGDELEEGDFHTLSNICELNMPSEEHKFPWFAFAKGLVRASGCRTLSKLGRWDDRDKISLDYTLLPYLTALLEQDKIDPSIAVALLRISAPAELYACGTEQMAEVIASKGYPNVKELLSELIIQFAQSNPGASMPSTLGKLHKIAERELGIDSEHCTYLSVAAPKFKKLQDEGNDNRNYHGERASYSLSKVSDQEEEARRAVESIVQEVDPYDEVSMSRAVEALNDVQNFTDLKRNFFEDVRAKLKYAERPRYINIISRLETFEFYAKLRELRECKSKWGGTSAALEDAFRDAGRVLMQVHADDFVHNDYLSGSQLKEVAELSGIPMSVLAIELIMIFAEPDSHLPASIWMALAAIICEKTKAGEGQLALKRLLNSNSAKLASTVVDGALNRGLYPASSETDIAAGLVWYALGSPTAACRWRAAYSLRCFARFGRWDVIDAIFERFSSTDAHPYQAPELEFYFLHARLWLLIAIARISKDFPQHVARYFTQLRSIALDATTPHVLFRHFAAQAVLECIKNGNLGLSKSEANIFSLVNKSPFPKKKSKSFARDSFYQDRSDSSSTSKLKFSLDYDFDKSEVTRIVDMFDRPRWEIKDAMTAWVRKYDKKITSMYEAGKRSVRRRNRVSGLDAMHHLYGQQLGQHALYLVAGDLLAKHKVVQRPYDDDNPWCEWLKREVLTKSDGFWLGDGTDRPPIDAQVNLFEQGEKGLVITGNKVKILDLLGIDSSIAAALVVAGDWRSADGILIRISSALVPPKQAKTLALKLSKKDPFQAWLPHANEHEEDDEYSRSEGLYTPWIVWPSIEPKLDETDPFGVDSALRRRHFTKAINANNSLRTLDSFRRLWVDPDGAVVVRSEAWGSNPARDEDDSVSADRLVCRTDFVKRVLDDQCADLLILIVLRRYNKGFGSQGNQYLHTTAVVRVKKNLEFEYYPGVVNEPHVTKY